MNCKIIYIYDDKRQKRDLYELEQAVAKAGKAVAEKRLMGNPSGSGWRALVQTEKEKAEGKEDREMYHFTASCLKEHGLLRYEISNYAKPGAECLHNLGYWTGRDYLGMGVGASSLWQGCRFHAPRRTDRYLDAVSRGDLVALRVDEAILSERDRMEEFMFLGLRLSKGVSEDDFRQRFGRPIRQIYGSVLEDHLANGLIVYEKGRFRLTEYGLDIANTVMADYLFD